MLRTLFQMIGAHYASGDFAAVESALRSVLAAVPNDSASLRFLGLVYYRTGRKAEAMHILRTTPSLPGTEPHSGAAAAEDFLGRHGYSAAAACHVEATQRNPDLALAWFDLGVAFGELGLPARAVAAFQAALLARPGFPAALRAMSALAERAGIPAGAAGTVSRHGSRDESHGDSVIPRGRRDGGMTGDAMALDDEA